MKTSTSVVAGLWLRVASASAGTYLQTSVPGKNVAKSLEFSPFFPRGFLARF